MGSKLYVNFDFLASKFIMNEWNGFYYKHCQSSNSELWKDFIESLNLGVVCINSHNDIYKITDEKKWFLAKIKYGF